MNIISMAFFREVKTGWLAVNLQYVKHAQRETEAYCNIRRFLETF